MSPGSFSGPIGQTPTALPTPALALGTQTPADLLSLSNQLRKKKSFLPLHPAAESADALEAAVGASGRGRPDLATDHPGTPRPQHPSLQSWMVSDATHGSPPSRCRISVSLWSSLVLHFHQLSPGI